MRKVEVIVSGTSGFPIDMLRYDSLMPATEEDSNKIEGLVAGRFAIVGPRIQIKLWGPVVPGQKVTSRVTNGRWKSFGWRVVHASIT